MNKFNFNQTGGFPLDTNVLDEMQRAYELLNFGALFIEPYVIVSGCEVTGSGSGMQVGAGIVAIDGEVMPFESGTGSGTVIIEETPVQKNFEDGTDKTVLVKRKARLGSGPGSFAFSSFKRLPNLLKSPIPVGLISMWAGAIGDIPTGWALCDGTSGTPNLSGRFVVGYDSTDIDYNTIGKKAGEKKHQLTESELPKIDPRWKSAFGQYNDVFDGRDGIVYSTVRPGNTYKNKTGIDRYPLESFGNNQPHENRPPYYTLAYIQFKGN